MKKIYLQYWEESEKGWGLRPDGCSLHLTMDDYNKFIKSIYDNRGDEVPNEYDKIVGEVVEAFIKDDLYYSIKGSLRLFQYELGNLIKLEEITVIC